jgi:D-2-hydroxyacid dehydrogenase (NADP+)
VAIKTGGGLAFGQPGRLLKHIAQVYLQRIKREQAILVVMRYETMALRNNPMWPAAERSDWSSSREAIDRPAITAAATTSTPCRRLQGVSDHSQWGLVRLLLLGLACVLMIRAQQKKILVADGDKALLQDLQSVTTKARIVSVSSANVMQELVEADAYIGEITSAEVRAGKNLKWVGIMSAGVEKVLFPADGSSELRHSNITLTNNKIVQGPEIADHALAMLLMLSRNLYALYRNDEQQIWNPKSFKGIELNGKTAVVVGVGGIGTQIAVRASAFGMTVIGVDPEDKPFLPFLKSVVKPDQFDDVLPQADVVFLSVPDTPKSHKMMGVQQFELMKKNSYFIAVSRGGIYDMNGLVKALDEKRLAGAGVDVTDPEPLPKGHALWKFNNVVITPHIAGRSDQDAARMTGTIKENIRRFVEGKPLINVVDKQKGY